MMDDPWVDFSAADLGFGSLEKGAEVPGSGNLAMGPASAFRWIFSTLFHNMEK